MSMLKRLFALVAVLTLAACGGGSSNPKAPDDDGGTATTDALNIVLSSATLENGGSNTVKATVTALDSNRNTVASAPVSFTVDGNAVLTPSAAVTDASGVVTAIISIGDDRSSRAVTVTAKSGNVSKSASFSVFGAALTTSASSPVVLNSEKTVEYQLKDSVGSAISGAEILVTLTDLSAQGGPKVIDTERGSTNAQGKFFYSFTAPESPGKLRLEASAAGETIKNDIEVIAEGGGTVSEASPIPVSASLTSTPSVVNINTASSDSNQVELRALFVGPGDVRVQNVRVVFRLADDSQGYGRIAPQGDTYAYSDANGVARGTFIAGTRSSPTNGVTVLVCWDTMDFDPSDCPNPIGLSPVSSKLTVASEALSVNIGANELISEGSDKLTYIKQFVVMVVDAAGQAKSDVTITPSVDLSDYYKGWYSWVDDKWVRRLSVSGGCINEDRNRNGALESSEDDSRNSVIDPAKADVSIRMISSKTDSAGLAIAQIEYPKDRGSWVAYTITVTASGISGTESRARYVGILPVPASALTNEQVPPAFQLSPYGSASACTDPN